jgi:hypothetical protein
MQVIMNEQNEIQYFIRNAHACSDLRSNILFPERDAYIVCEGTFHCSMRNT